MFEKFKENFPKFEIEKFRRELGEFCRNGPEESNYDFSYPHFLEYFENLTPITKHNLIIGINFVYGWMPTILTFKGNKNFEEAVGILNKAKLEGNITTKNLNILKALFNNSLVGTSKLLHFINPNKFAIWDSGVYRYLTGKEYKKAGEVESYMAFLELIRNLTGQEWFKEVDKMSKFRAAELIMFTNDPKKNSQKK